MTFYRRNLWHRAGITQGGWENIPRDGTPFLAFHPKWAFPAVCGFSDERGQVIFLDPVFNTDLDDYIVDFTDIVIYIYEDPPYVKTAHE